MKIVKFEDLQSADLYVDACYQGGRFGNARDTPLPKLLSIDNQGGIRKRGKVNGKLEMVVLVSSMNDPDWPDAVDRETGVFTYYGDNKEPGRDLHDTGRDGNIILQRIFADARSGAEVRATVPPIFVFANAGSWRDVIFLGLAVPGASDLDASEELVAIWRTAEGSRFQNYRARFTILDAGVIRRKWIESIVSGARDDSHAPTAWLNWVRTGIRRPLLAPRLWNTESRSSSFRRTRKAKR